MFSEKSPDSEIIINQTNERHEAWIANIKNQLAETKANLSSDKEIFDINAFAKLYDLTNDRGESIISSELIEDLEIQYYLKNPGLKSMKEFAEKREFLDGHNVG